MNIKSRDLIQTAILLIAINFAIIYANIIGYESFHNTLTIVAKLIFALSIFILFQLFFKNTRITHLSLCFIYFPSYTAELFNLSILNQYISFDNLKAVYNTNLTEALKFVIDLLSNFWLPCFIILTLSINIIYLSKEKIIITNHTRYIALSAVGIVITFLQQFSKTIDSPELFAKRNLISSTIDRIIKTPPINIFYRSYQVFVNVNRLNKVKAQRETFTFGVYDSSHNRPGKVVLIVSEGMRSSNWAINGYKKSTNPNLSSIDNLISFKQHYANANNTYNSIPLIITKATPQNQSIAYSEKSIISLFKEAGFKTVWISNQDIFYLDNQEEPDSTIITYTLKDKTDLAVLSPFKHILSENKEKNLFVLINLVGNHGTIPGPFNDQFKPNSSLTHSEILPKNKEKLINDYDNKILLQDYVLSKIINTTLETGESTVILFTADHGLNLFDDKESNIFGYGSDYPTKHELHIPLLIWCSDLYTANNETKYNNLINNISLYSDNDNVLYTLSDLSTINFREFDSCKSLAHEKYISKPVIPVYLNQTHILFDLKNQ